MFVIKVAQKVTWSKAGQQRKLLSLPLIIWISKQLVSRFCAMKGVYLGKGHEVILLSMSIMSHTTKHILQFYNNPLQWFPMSECMSKCYNPVIRRGQKTGLQWNTKTIMVQDAGVQLVDTNPNDIEILQILASGPSTMIHRYTSHDINDYTFYTRAQDNKKTNQNSDV
jgi:hypothetical protein